MSDSVTDPLPDNPQAVARSRPLRPRNIFHATAVPEETEFRCVFKRHDLLHFGFAASVACVIVA